MKKIVALTGANGNMGKEALRELAASDDVAKIKILLLNNIKGRAFGAAAKRRYGKKLEIVYGDVADSESCLKLIKTADYVFNCAAVIPPLSDSRPNLALRCNYEGAKTLTDAVKLANENDRPKFVHVSTVAVYGHRNYLHPWGRVGDPLLPSVYDCYAASKVKGERYVMESGLESWAVLRQTAMLHDNMFNDNMKDGLMFHTCMNVPLEWVSARDSGYLIRRIVERDANGEVDDFWRKCYNVGGGQANRITGYETFDSGFKIIGGSVEKFMKPEWQSIRNFHGMWFADGDELEKMFSYQRESVEDCWRKTLKYHSYYSLAKIIPSKFIRKAAVERLLGDKNAPKKWLENKETGKIKAYFGSQDNVSCLQPGWESYPVLAKGQLADGEINYESLRDLSHAKETGLMLSHGFDENKPIADLDIDSMREAAKFRGGACLSNEMKKGGLYEPLAWKCHDGHIFTATPYTVLFAGHWCPECCEPEPWDFDRLAKFTPFFAQVWYDSHAKEENRVYYYDESHTAKFKYLGVSA